MRQVVAHGRRWLASLAAGCMFCCLAGVVFCCLLGAPRVAVAQDAELELDTEIDTEIELDADTELEADPVRADAEVTDPVDDDADPSLIEVSGEQDPTEPSETGAIERLQDDEQDAFGFTVPGTGDEPWEISDVNELRSEGWRFREQRGTPGSAGHGGIALSVGLFIHGAGHFRAGDTQSAIRLLVAEAVSIALFGAAGLVRGLSAESQAVVEIANGMQIVGGSLFLTSWLADVVGAFKGTSIPLPSNVTETRGFGAEAFFSVIAGADYGFGSLLTGRLDLQLGRFFFTPEAEAAINLVHRAVRLQTGTRFPLTDRGSYLDIGALIADESTALDGNTFGRNRLGGSVSVAVNAGEWFEHLSGLMWTNEIGSVVDFFFFESDRGRRFQLDQSHVSFPISTQFSANLSTQFNLAVGYSHRNDRLVGAGSTGGYVYETLEFVPRNRLGFAVSAEHGRYHQISVGFRWRLAQQRDD